MRKRDKQLLVVIIALIMMLLVVIAGVIIYLNSDSNEKKKDDLGKNDIIVSTENSSVPENNNYNQILSEGLEIETVVGTLYFSEEFEECLKIDNLTENDYSKIKVYMTIHEDKRLFDFYIGTSDEESVYIGKTSKGGKLYDVFVNMPQLEFSDEWSEEEKQYAYIVQEEMNQLIWQLELVQEGSGLNVTEEVEEIVIKSENMDFVYSGNWKDEIKTVDKGEIVEFWAILPGYEEIHLFDVTLNGSGDVLGSIITEGEEIEIGVIIHILELDDSLSEEDKAKICSMQEDVNIIIENLYEDENFVPKK